MQKANILGYGGALTTIFTAMNITSEVVQVIYYILGAVALLLSISLTIYKWYKTSHADGKVTADEIQDLVDKINDINKNK